MLLFFLDLWYIHSSFTSSSFIFLPLLSLLLLFSPSPPPPSSPLSLLFIAHSTSKPAEPRLVPFLDPPVSAAKGAAVNRVAVVVAVVGIGVVGVVVASNLDQCWT